MIRLDEKNAKSFVSEEAWNKAAEDAEEAAGVLQGKEGAGNDFLGWLDRFSEQEKISFVISLSVDPATLPESVLQYGI